MSIHIQEEEPANLEQPEQQPSIGSYVRPSNGLQANRIYKQRPLSTKQKASERCLGYSKSFVRPKCPTIELRKPDLLAVEYGKRIDF